MSSLFRNTVSDIYRYQFNSLKISNYHNRAYSFEINTAHAHEMF